MALRWCRRTCMRFRDSTRLCSSIKKNMERVYRIYWFPCQIHVWWTSRRGYVRVDILASNQWWLWLPLMGLLDTYSSEYLLKNCIYCPHHVSWNFECMKFLWETFPWYKIKCLLEIYKASIQLLLLQLCLVHQATECKDAAGGRKCSPKSPLPWGVYLLNKC